VNADMHKHRIYLSNENNVVVEELLTLSDRWTKALIVLVCLRLGTKHVNELYRHHLKYLFTMPSCLGIVGGRPNHSVYFVGSVDDHLYYLDPHVVQKYQPLNVELKDVAEEERKFKSFHCVKPSSIPIDQLDPSCAVGFLINNQRELDEWIKVLTEAHIISTASRQSPENALFSVMQERPLTKHSPDGPTIIDDGFELI